MIAALHPPLRDHDRNPSVTCRIGHDAAEGPLVDVIRAAAGHERSPRRQQLERPEVDLLVSGHRAGRRATVLRERRGVENDRVEPLSASVELAQQVEPVADLGPDVRDAVQRGVALDGGHRVLGDIDREHLVAPARYLQRESTGVAEHVEGASPRVTGSRHPVFPLVEKQPGLLSGPRMHVELDRALAHPYGLGDLAGDEFNGAVEPFERPDARVVSRKDPGGPDELVQQPRDPGQLPVHPLRERLDDEHVRIAVDDERRQQVPLAVDQTIRGGIDGEAVATTPGGRQPAPPPVVVGAPVVPCQQTDGDRRPIAKQPVPQYAATRPDHANDVAGLGTDIGHIGTEHPQVPAADAVLAA